MDKKDREKKGLLANLFKLLVFLFPTQLAFHFWPSWSFIQGIRIDYFSPAIYLTDIVLVALFFAWWKDEKTLIKKFFRKNAKLTVAIFLFLVINIAFSKNRPLSFFKTLKIIELLFFTLFILVSKLKTKNLFYKPLIFSTFLICLIGITHFLKGESLNGVFWLLGERSFTSSTPGISLINFLGKERLRAYSIFSHPNSFSGYLLVAAILLFEQKGKSIFKSILLFLLGSAFFLTFSLGSTLGLVFAFLFSFIKKNKAKIFFLAIIFLSLLSPIYFPKITLLEDFGKEFKERIFLAEISGRIISQNYFIGVGFNNFILSLVPYFSSVGVWLLQPVHNIFLLVFAELGIFGVMGFSLLFLKAFETNNNYLRMCLIAILITGALDHYWLTLQQNLLMFSFVLGLSLRDQSD